VYPTALGLLDRFIAAASQESAFFLRNSTSRPIRVDYDAFTPIFIPRDENIGKKGMWITRLSRDIIAKQKGENEEGF